MLNPTAQQADAKSVLRYDGRTNRKLNPTPPSPVEMKKGATHKVPIHV